MPAYRYEAVDAAGKTDRGVIEADSPKQARTHLRTRGLTPLTVDALGSAAQAARGSAVGSSFSIENSAIRQPPAMIGT